MLDSVVVVAGAIAAERISVVDMCSSSGLDALGAAPARGRHEGQRGGHATS